MKSIEMVLSESESDRWPNRPEAVWVERAGEAVGRRKHSSRCL